MISWLRAAAILALVVTANAAVPDLTPTRVHVVSQEAGIDITTQKVIRILGPMTRWSIRRAAQEGAATVFLPGDRVVVINSGGGDVEAGQKLIDALMVERRSGTRIVCVAIGNAHSMAFDLLSFCDVRLATAKTKMVAHKIEYTALPYEMRETARNLRKLARELDKIDAVYDTQNAKMMHLDSKHYDMYADRENQWTAEQLLIMKYLNGIATVENL